MRPPIVIILQTYKRTDVALRTIAAACARLAYQGDLHWYVADDGSPAEHVQRVRDELTFQEACVIGHHSERRGYGANCNTAWRMADATSPLTLWLEDDWELTAPLDLTHYADLLIEREEIGMVRLGILNIDIKGRTWGHAGHLYWTLDHIPHHDGTPVFTGHPSLRHVRYRDVYGWYPEGLSPGDTELAYAYQYRIGAAAGPAILWPVDYPAYGLFGHIGIVKSETLL